MMPEVVHMVRLLCVCVRTSCFSTIPGHSILYVQYRCVAVNDERQCELVEGL